MQTIATPDNPLELLAARGGQWAVVVDGHPFTQVRRYADPHCRVLVDVDSVHATGDAVRGLLAEDNRRARAQTGARP